MRRRLGLAVRPLLWLSQVCRAGVVRRFQLPLCGPLHGALGGGMSVESPSPRRDPLAALLCRALPRARHLGSRSSCHWEAR